MRNRPTQVALNMEVLESRVLLDGHLTGALADATTRIADTELRGGKANIRAFAELDGRLLLTVKTDATNGPLQLWETDGSADGTQKVLETTSGVYQPWFQETGMLVIDDHAYFVVDRWEQLDEPWDFSRAATIELWKTDGTIDGTSLVTTVSGLDHPPPTTGAFDVSLHRVSDEAFMIVLSEALVSAFASSDWFGTLWVSDGSAEGTRAIKETFEYVNGPPLSVLAELNGQWVFGGGYLSGPSFVSSGLYTVSPERELVERLGTFSGASLDGVLGNYELTRVGDTIYFGANGQSGYELWRTDGTADGTGMVIDIHPGTSGSSPKNLTDVDGTLFFNAADPEHGREWWKSDGTEDGTMLVRDIMPGSKSTRFGTETLVSNGLLYFTIVSSDGSNTELWVTDGTEVGTEMLAAFSLTRASFIIPEPHSMVEVDGTVYFSIDDGSSDVQIWMTDGTSKGTELALRITTRNHGEQPVRLIAHEHQLIFAALESFNDLALWSINLSADNALAADVNGSGMVDFADFLVLAGNFGKDVSRGRADGDIDEDGTVSLQDFQILARDFGRSPSGS